MSDNYDTNTAYAQGYKDGVYDTVMKELTAAEEYFKDGYSLGFEHGRKQTTKQFMSQLNYTVDKCKLDNLSLERTLDELKEFIHTYCVNARGGSSEY